MALLPAATYLGALARMAARGFRARGAEGALPRKKLVVERSGIRVEPRRLARYLAVTQGGGIERFRGPGAILPPVYPAVWETALGLELLVHPEMPPLPGGMLHLESESLPLRPLGLDDPVRCRLELERSEPHRRGIRATLLCRNWNAAGQLCSEDRMVLLLRTVRGSRDGSDPARPAGQEKHREEGEEDDGLDWTELTRWKLRGSHGRRYARVSGDYNPIHLWSVTARPFGFRRPILHGFCTQALVAHALIERLCEGDPIRLRRLWMRFRAPLLLPAAVALQTVQPPGEGTRLRVVGASRRNEGKVYAEGTFVGG